MPFVLDASTTACWALEDEDHPVADLAYARIKADEARVPTVWWFEIRNVLLTGERRKRLGPGDTAAFLRTLLGFSITVDGSPIDAEVLDLARQHRLTVYDASYLELARRERLTLATLDQALARAARAERVDLLE